MRQRTVRALIASIVHWHRMALGHKKENDRPGRGTCALCSLFNTDTTPHADTCRGCPVLERTGLRLCSFTPYGAAYEAWNRLDRLPSSRFEARWLEAAALERDFLYSLLPSENRKRVQARLKRMTARFNALQAKDSS